mmetsp:Transcript_13390/g.37020  ORF Transcript_13390/g.37020 Transcript_13390/m.37020 type:complete len:352 (-) Transcript_13390:1141-2196(-)
MQRNLGDALDVQHCLASNNVLSRFLKAPDKFPLFLFSSLDERSTFCTARKFVEPKSLEKFRKTKAAVENANCTALGKILRAKARILGESLFADGVDTLEDFMNRVMEVAQRRVIVTRPLLWSSLFKCRPPKIDAGVRMKALEALEGHRLLKNFDRSATAASFREFLDSLPEPQPPAPRQEGALPLPFSEVHIETIMSEASSIWSRGKDIEKGNLLLEFEKCRPALMKGVENFGLEYLPKLKDAMYPPSAVQQIQSDLEEQMRNVRPARIIYAFNNMSSGRYKSFNIYNIMTQPIKCPKREDIEAPLTKLVAHVEGCVLEYLVDIVCRTLNKARPVQSRQASARSDYQGRGS